MNDKALSDETTLIRSQVMELVALLLFEVWYGQHQKSEQEAEQLQHTRSTESTKIKE